jgi:hypothetical protein
MFARLQFETEYVSVSANPYGEQLTGKIGKWIEDISTPEFRQFKRKQIAYTIVDGFDRENLVEPPAEFAFSNVVERQHVLVMSFLELKSSSNALTLCEYYFRRYPFRGLPVSREEHIKNICELYLGQFYIIKNRIKVVFKRIREAYPHVATDFGSLIRAYDKEFNQELRARNKVSHHLSFEDLEIDRVMLTGMMSSTEGDEGKTWMREHLRAYRAASKEWSTRAKQRSASVQRFVDAVAKCILDHATFL